MVRTVSRSRVEVTPTRDSWHSIPELSYPRKNTRSVWRPVTSRSTSLTVSWKREQRRAKTDRLDFCRRSPTG